MPSLRRRRRDLVDAADVEERSLDLTNPAVAEYFGGALNLSGENVNETTSMSLSGIWRAGCLISQAIGTLPLKSFQSEPDDQRKRVDTFLDDPCGPEADGEKYLTPFEWKETVALHLFYQGEAFLYHRRNADGVLLGLIPIHPLAVTVNPSDTAPGGKTFDVALKDGKYTRDLIGGTGPNASITHIVGPCVRGLRGMSFLSVGRTSIGIGLAAEKSAAGMFRQGAILPGVLVPRDGEILSEQDVEELAADLDRRLGGTTNAGRIPIMNKVLEFQPWAMTNADAQWMESRAFQIEEVARWTGLPPVFLMQVEKQTSWGSGIAEQNTNLSQYVLRPYTKRIEERVSRLLSTKRFAEFDFAGLVAGSPQEESALLLSDVNGGLRTPNEARRIKNIPPVEGGDELRVPSGVMLNAQLLANAAPPDVPSTDPEVEAALALAKAAPSLVQNPGLVALTNQLKDLAGKPRIEVAAAPAAAPAEGSPDGT